MSAAATPPPASPVQGAPSPVAGGRPGLSPTMRALLIGAGGLAVLYASIFGLPGGRGDGGGPRMPDERAGEIGRAFTPDASKEASRPAMGGEAAPPGGATPASMPMPGVGFAGGGLGAGYRVRRVAPSAIAAYQAPAEPPRQPSQASTAGAEGGDGRRGQGDDAVAGMRPLRAARLPSPEFWLMPGDKIPCVQDEPIVSVDGAPFSCRVPHHVFGRTGTVPLLERGTRLVGNVVRALERGEQRLAVAFTHAETPAHRGEDPIVVPLDSPGADVAGRAGLDGNLNTHFWSRLSAVAAYALLDTTVNAGSAAAGGALGRALSGGQGGIGIGIGIGLYNPFGGQGRTLAGREFEAQIGRRPTIERNQGEPLTVFLRHPVDFRSVVALRTVRAEGGR